MAIFLRSIAVLALVVSVSAQAPTPRALKEGRAIFLVSENVEQKGLDELAKHLQRWGAVRLTDTEESADLVATLGVAKAGLKAVYPIGGAFFSVDYDSWVLAIRPRQVEKAIYTDRELIGDFSRYGGLRKLVDRWRARAESK